MSSARTDYHATNRSRVKDEHDTWRAEIAGNRYRPLSGWWLVAIGLAVVAAALVMGRL